LGGAAIAGAIASAAIAKPQINEVARRFKKLSPPFVLCT
jgi:hypothetical protein